MNFLDRQKIHDVFIEMRIEVCNDGYDIMYYSDLFNWTLVEDHINDLIHEG